MGKRKKSWLEQNSQEDQSYDVPDYSEQAAGEQVSKPELDPLTLQSLADKGYLKQSFVNKQLGPQTDVEDVGPRADIPPSPNEKKKSAVIPEGLPNETPEQKAAFDAETKRMQEAWRKEQAAKKPAKSEPMKPDTAALAKALKSPPPIGLEEALRPKGPAVFNPDAPNIPGGAMDMSPAYTEDLAKAVKAPPPIGLEKALAPTDVNPVGQPNPNFNVGPQGLVSAPGQTNTAADIQRQAGPYQQPVPEPPPDPYRLQEQLRRHNLLPGEMIHDTQNRDYLGKQVGTVNELTALHAQTQAEVAQEMNRRNLEQERMLRDQQRYQEEYQKSMAADQAKLEAERQKIINNKIDPNRFMKDNPAQFIAGVLGAAMLGYTHSDAGLKMLQNRIDRDIAAQESDLGSKKEGLSAGQNLLNQKMKTFQDLNMAKASLRSDLLLQSKLKAEQMMAKAGPDETKIRGQAMVDSLNKAYNDSQFQLSQLSDQRAAQKAAAAGAAAAAAMAARNKTEEQLRAAWLADKQVRTKEGLEPVSYEKWRANEYSNAQTGQGNSFQVVGPSGKTEMVSSPNEDARKELQGAAIRLQNTDQMVDELIALRKKHGQAGNWPKADYVRAESLRNALAKSFKRPGENSDRDWEVLLARIPEITDFSPGRAIAGAEDSTITNLEKLRREQSNVWESYKNTYGVPGSATPTEKDLGGKRQEGESGVPDNEEVSMSPLQRKTRELMKANPSLTKTRAAALAAQELLKKGKTATEQAEEDERKIGY